jgi:hypothetical protein
MKIIYCEYCKAFYVGHELSRCKKNFINRREHPNIKYYMNKVPKEEELEAYEMFRGEGILPIADMTAAEIVRMSCILSKAGGTLIV